MIRKFFEYIIIRKSGLFSPYDYLRRYKDVRRADVDPLWHYVNHGWKEGRNPSDTFDTNFYLKSNPDVEVSGVNPLVHYLRYGQKEGRRPKPEKQSLLSSFKTDHNFQPKVTVIVPSYNHEPFLDKRLESIYQQTYTNFEVVLLDDCSSDDSQSILKKYAEKHPDNTRCFFNDMNSGSPFAQWEKGMRLAEGDLIWIAESDDFCDTNFLETLVPFFSDESILLSYAQPIFVDRSGGKHPFAFETYVSQIDPEKWNSPYIETAHNEVNAALGLLNTIPNVSGAIFRKIDGKFALFDDPDWLKMKVCGDWIFYLHLICGGKIAYSNDTHSYFRIHQAGTSKKAQIQDVYYQEHEKVGAAVASLYKIPDDLLIRFYNRVKSYYFDNVPGGTQEKLDACFNLESILSKKKDRKPNALIATYGFVYGGGEIFPIRLANALREMGVGVTFFNGGFEPTQPLVRKMINSNIAVINYESGMDFRSVLNDFGIEIIHTHHASMENLLAVLRGKENHSVKHVATLHGMYEMMANRFVFNTKDTLNSVDHWVYTADKNLLPFKNRKLFSETKFTKIDNGMKVPHYQKVDLSNLGISANSYVACLVSRALPEKGWQEAIDAVGLVRQKSSQDFHLILIGEGPMFAQLKEVALPEYVHMLGFKSNPGDYLISSKIGLIPSYFKGESFPLVMIECFMAEIPVIASRIGETERMMTADNHKIGGILIDLHHGKVSSEELADAILKLSSDPDFYTQSLEAVLRLKQRFDIDQVAAQYLAVYRKVLGQHSL